MKELKDMSIVELKAALFDLDQQIKQAQHSSQIIAQQLSKAMEKENLKTKTKEEE